MPDTWTPPASDKVTTSQGWTPPASDRVDAGGDWETSVGHMPDDRTLLEKAKAVWDQAQAATTQRRKALLAHPIQTVVTELGNAPAAISPGGLVRMAREGLGVTQPFGFERYLPDPTVAGAVKGLTDVVTAPVQFGAHLVGPAPVAGAIDRGVTGIQNYYDQNFAPSRSGEVLGQVLPFALTGGASEAAPVAANGSKAAQALKLIAKSAAVGAVAAPTFTPEAGVQSDADFAARKLAEAKSGAKFGAVLGAIPGAVQLGASTLNGMRQLASTPAPAELLDTLGAKLGGKSPGEALQAAAHEKYNAAWDEFKKAVAPVDAAAPTAQVDYSPAVAKLEEVLGVGQPRKPFNMPTERRQVLEELLSDLKAAQDPANTGVSNSFEGAIDVVKRLGSEQRRLAVTHGDSQAREMLGDVRDAVLQSMQQSSPDLAAKAAEARRVFASKVVPLFDKSEGGNLLTKIRDSATPGDLLGAQNQGALTRIKPDAARIIAKGASADPLLYSYLDAAINQAKGNPRAFADSISKAMPAIEAIADPQTLKAFQGLQKVARTSTWTGRFANLGLAAVPGYHEAGATLGMALNFNPAHSGPGLVWKALQSPATRKLLSLAAKMPEGSPELELIGKDIMKTLPASTRLMTRPVPEPVPMPLAAQNQQQTQP